MFNAVVIMAAALVGQADGAKTDDDLKLEVLRLVRRLDARELADREAAEKALMEVGPKALDLLPPVDERTPAEVRQRLDRIKVLLQKEQAEAAAGGREHLSPSGKERGHGKVPPNAPHPPAPSPTEGRGGVRTLSPPLP